MPEPVYDDYIAHNEVGKKGVERYKHIQIQELRAF